MIESIINPHIPEVGERLEGTVVSTTTFGAFVSIGPGRDGLIHISRLGRGKRIANVEEVLRVGDKLTVEVVDVDPDKGKVGLKPVGEGWDPPEGGWPREEGEGPPRERRPRPEGEGRDRGRGFRPRRDRDRGDRGERRGDRREP
jgi:transcriptional accessory protein Tex/SPT6